jgi:hypothetical protein
MTKFTGRLEDDLNDPLPSFDGSDQPLAKRGLPPVTPFKPAIERFEEPCSKCRGTGSFIGWSGRRVGNCFECKGTGKHTFKTSADHRAKGRAQAAIRRERQQDEVRQTAEAWSAEHKAETLWLVQAANRQEALKAQGRQVWEFPISLLAALGKFGSLTEGQLSAVRKCIAKDAARAAERETAKVAVDVSKIENAFTTAREKATRKGQMGIWMRPLVLRSGETDVTFRPGSEGSKWEGMIFAKSGEKKLGFVKDGKFSPSFICTEVEQAAVLDCAADPHGAAKTWGKAYSRCTICGQTLTNDESIERGIGPICAEKYGW